MSIEGTDTRCLRELQAGDQDALATLWEKYFRRIAGLARRQLGNLTQRSGNEEDVALSAFKSFWRGIEDDRFEKLKDRNDLWELLAVITSRKVNARRQYELAQCRNPAREKSLDQVSASDVPPASQITSPELDPQILVEAGEECEHLLGMLSEKRREVALMKLSGFTNEEIGEKLERSTATVERHLRGIRRIWTEFDPAES